MKLQKNQDRINYLPNREEGRYIFDGLPYASMQVLELIGSEGIHHIDQKLKAYLLQRMEMFGNGSPIYYGFAPHQRFFDVKKQVLLDVKAIINKNENGFQKKHQGYTISINDEHDFLIDRELEDDGPEAQIELLKNGVLYNKFPIDSKS